MLDIVGKCGVLMVTIHIYVYAGKSIPPRTYVGSTLLYSTLESSAEYIHISIHIYISVVRGRTRSMYQSSESGLVV